MELEFLIPLKNTLDDILNWILPARCFCCGELLDHYKNIACKSCLQELESERLDDSRISVEEYENIDEIISLFPYSERIHNLIHNFKYNDYPEIAAVFRKWIKYFFFENEYNPQDWIVIPVPLHNVRLRERGYNQAEYIAEIVSECSFIEMRTDIVERSMYTKMQAKLSKVERKANLENAFRIKKLFDKRNVLLIDDVFTTGATMISLAGELKRNGVDRIHAFTIARA